jgi:hypothetical protein
MAKEKSLVEEAIIQMKNLEEAVAENAKGILASTMKEEIKELVKESLTEQEDEIETDVEMDEPEMEDDMSDEEGMEMDTDNLDMDMDDEDSMEDDSMDDDETIDLTGIDDEDEILRVFSLMGPEDNIVVTKDDSGNINLKDSEKEYMIVGEGEEFMDDSEEMFEMDDMSDFGMEDEEDEDEDIDSIISKVFDNDNDELEEMDFEEEDELEFGEEEGMDSDEIVYEIEFDEEGEEDMGLTEEDEDEEEMFESYEEEDEDMEEEPVMESKKMSIKPKGVGMGNPNKKKVYSNKPNQEGGFKTVKKTVNKTMGTGKAKFEYKEGENLDGKMKSVKKVETKEAARTLGNGSNFRKGGLPKPRAHSKANTAIQKESVDNKELQVLREKNEEYRKALNVFRNKLNEVAVFNSNLAYATRLFTEHSTSKQEKINILRRFDGVETIKESKNLYKTLKDELSSTASQPMNESIERTIQSSPTTGSAANLIESKTYENPQFLRMKDLMSKLK